MAPPRITPDDDEPGWAEFDPRDYGDDDHDEPIGSCEWCGTNLYPDDDEDLCDQCAWAAEQNKGTRSGGIEPIV